ncbi:cysteine desulfurase-like protein [Telmatocola sphagniphila]|uniref:Cysteine desulfurase-like protein n=1 Tax=Telmatocola sphagniphila TaxID=1123043 RepID=A0A8E6B350_9BACT|nr:cysteine desulfurase-like protein [Telmatocola sphagniphila]QVL30987.1 cysteine desulfurase-like protein [Telmatocola sphagniphila]
MLDVKAIRSQFPALARKINSQPIAYLDGPAGSQVPTSVPAAISDYLLNHNANHGGAFATSRESDAIVEGVQKKVAGLLGAQDHSCVAFGANMTTMTFAYSRAIAARWNPGDEVIVTRLDHDANVSPWVRAAQDRGAVVRPVEIHPEDCTLDRDHFRSLLNSRTKLVALGCVSNAVGTRNPVKEMIAEAHQVGAWVYLDAVHHAPHLKIDVTDWDCDFLACSAYKFFGPHIGIVWGKRQHLETLPAYKVRPAPESLPDRWMTGTQNFECIAGVGAAVDYMNSVGISAIEEYERELAQELIAALQRVPGLKIYGIVDPKRYHERVSTVSFTMAGHTPTEIAKHLARENIFVWSGNYYALPLTERLGLEPQGMVRVGLLHYNTVEEIAMLEKALQELVR